MSAVLLAIKPSVIFFPLVVVYLLKGLITYIIRTDDEEDADNQVHGVKRYSGYVTGGVRLLVLNSRE